MTLKVSITVTLSHKDTSLDTILDRWETQSKNITATAQVSQVWAVVEKVALEGLGSTPDSDETTLYIAQAWGL